MNSSVMLCNRDDYTVYLNIVVHSKYSGLSAKNFPES